jgi:hypothetical protein
MSEAPHKREPFRYPPAKSYLERMWMKLESMAAGIPDLSDYIHTHAEELAEAELREHGPFTAWHVACHADGIRAAAVLLPELSISVKGRRRTRSKFREEPPRRPGRGDPPALVGAIGVAVLMAARAQAKPGTKDNAIYERVALSLGSSVERGHVKTLERRWLRRLAEARANNPKLFNLALLAILRVQELLAPDIDEAFRAVEEISRRKRLCL